MSLLDEPSDQPPATSGIGRFVAFTALLVVVGVGVGVYLGLPLLRNEEPEVAERAAPAPTAPTRALEADAEPAPLPPPLEPEPEPETPAAVEPESEPDAPVPPPVRLRVTSDIEGADIFIDRRFVGKTPFESGEVEPGPHRVNVSATGYDGHAEDVVIGDRVTEITARFTEVRLAQRVAVVHKHRFGDCAGQLVASVDGIRYETDDDDDDAFAIPLSELEEFAVNYLKHNLRIKPRDGRTYNFTDRAENADALFVFHREVERARERLSTGRAGS